MGTVIHTACNHQGLQQWDCQSNEANAQYTIFTKNICFFVVKDVFWRLFFCDFPPLVFQALLVCDWPLSFGGW